MGFVPPIGTDCNTKRRYNQRPPCARGFAGRVGSSVQYGRLTQSHRGVAPRFVVRERVATSVYVEPLTRTRAKAGSSIRGEI
jgi:hypothetical protein